MKKIAIGADHAGFNHKEKLKLWLENKGYSITDFGTGNSESTDYPDYAHPVAEAVANKVCDLGLLICGSGNGVAMTANKHPNIRAALCWTEELGALARQHNNANILCLPARFITEEQSQKILDRFLQADFEGGRHERRVNKISC